MKANIKKLCEQQFRLNRLRFYREQDGPLLASVNDIFDALDFRLTYHRGLDGSQFD